VYRSNALVFIVVVLPLALWAVLSPSFAVAQGQYNFFVPPAYAGTGNLFVADFNGDGKLDLLSSDGTLQLGNGDGTFTTGTPVPGTPLAVADFNGDGKPDVLEQGTDTLLVLLGNGDGTFQAPIGTNANATLTAIAAGDLNGDAKADVVGVFNDSLLVYLSNGDGTFAAGVPYSLGTTSAAPKLITLDDFNGDKRTDVAVSIAGVYVPGQEIVFLGNGDGTFQTAIPSTGVSELESVVAGDFNADGKLDLAISVPSYAPSPGVSILLGNGDGTFQAPALVIPNDGHLAVADLNGDGKLDLVLMSDFVEIYLGNGAGAFSSTHSYYPLPSTLYAVAVADFNLDGKPDIAAGNYLLFGNGDGTFRGLPGSPLPSGSPVFSQILDAVVGDFDRNAAPYVAVLGFTAVAATVYILTNDGTGALTLAHTYTSQQGMSGIATGDLNGDGNLDLVAAGPTGYIVLLGNGDGSFQPPVFYQLANGTQQSSMVIADFNRDGKLDLVFPSANQTVAVLLGHGDGTFGAPAYFFDAGAVSLVSADFNGDGKPDLAAGGASGIVILLGNGDGTFQPATFIYTSGIGALFTADLNGDGKSDLITSFNVFLGKGDGTFTTLPFGDFTVDALADVNGDGKPDVIGPQNSSCCGFHLGNGDGTFGPYIAVLNIGTRFFPFVPAFVLANDMNGDSKPDVIMGGDLNIGDGNPNPGVFVLINTTTPITVNLSPGSLGFDPENVGVSNQLLSTTLTNTGNLPLTISSIGITGANRSDFSQINNCPNSVPVNDSCKITVAFRPTADGNRNAAVAIRDNAPNSPQFIPLSGTGTGQSSNLNLGVASGGSSSATVGAGSMATYNLSIGGAGFSGMASLTCTGAPQGANCSFPSGATMNVSGSNASQFNVTVTTTPRAMAAFSPASTGSRSWLWAVLLIGVVILPSAKPRRHSTWRIMRLSPLLLLVVLCACGGSTSTNPIGTPAGTYPLTVKATSGSASQSLPLTLTVQ
jgi:hypothetical protein